MKKITFFIGFLCIVGNLSASLVKVEFEGVIDSVGSSSDLLPSYLTVGATYSGYYTYETIPDSLYESTNAKGYYYYSGQSGMYLEIVNPNNTDESLIIQTNPNDVDYSISISNSDKGDYYIKSKSNNINSQVLSPVLVFQCIFNDSVNDSLELRPATIEEYASNYLFVQGKDYSNELVDFNFGGVVTKTTVVPEPSIVSMVVIGTIGIIKRRKR